jgi:hypothetical protein
MLTNTKTPSATCFTRPGFHSRDSFWRMARRSGLTRSPKLLTSHTSTSPKAQQRDRAAYPILDLQPQPEVFAKTAPMTVGAKDPTTRDREAIAWVASNYVTGFTYRGDTFKAPVAGRYNVRFSGYTLWAAPLPTKKYLPDFEHISRGRGNEAINVYTRDGVLNRHVGSFDLTPDPAVHDVGEVWLLSGETLVPDASRLYRSRPNNFRNPLMHPMARRPSPSSGWRWKARSTMPPPENGYRTNLKVTDSVEWGGCQWE